MISITIYCRECTFSVGGRTPNVPKCKNFDEAIRAASGHAEKSGHELKISGGRVTKTD